MALIYNNANGKILRKTRLRFLTVDLWHHYATHLVLYRNKSEQYRNREVRIAILWCLKSHLMRINHIVA